MMKRVALFFLLFFFISVIPLVAEDAFTLEERYQYVRERLLDEGLEDLMNRQQRQEAKERRAAYWQEKKERWAASHPEKSYAGQTRNTVSVKMSNCEFDIAGTIAMCKHWYLYASIGGTDMPDDFMEKEFKDWECDQEFLYNALAGLGFNVRLGEELFKKHAPNLFIGGMMGPAICTYKRGGEYHNRGYLMRRATVGVDVPVYKAFGITADFSLDWVEDFEVSPRFAVGFQWNFGDWNIYDWW